MTSQERPRKGQWITTRTDPEPVLVLQDYYEDGDIGGWILAQQPSVGRPVDRYVDDDNWEPYDHEDAFTKRGPGPRTPTEDYCLYDIDPYDRDQYEGQWVEVREQGNKEQGILMDTTWYSSCDVYYPKYKVTEEADVRDVFFFNPPRKVYDPKTGKPSDSSEESQTESPRNRWVARNRLTEELEAKKKEKDSEPSSVTVTWNGEPLTIVDGDTYFNEQQDPSPGDVLRGDEIKKLINAPVGAIYKDQDGDACIRANTSGKICEDWIAFSNIRAYRPDETELECAVIIRWDKKEEELIEPVTPDISNLTQELMKPGTTLKGEELEALVAAPPGTIYEDQVGDMSVSCQSEDAGLYWVPVPGYAPAFLPGGESLKSATIIRWGDQDGV